MGISGQQELTKSINQGLPVFRGLEDVTIPGKEIAAIAGVTAPTFSRWRAGRARVPETKLIFLTLLLAHWIDELEDLLNNQDIPKAPKIETMLNTTRRCLFQQEVFNKSLSPEKVREGSHLFKKWWFEECARVNKSVNNESLYQ